MKVKHTAIIYIIIGLFHILPIQRSPAKIATPNKSTPLSHNHQNTKLLPPPPTKSFYILPIQRSPVKITTSNKSTIPISPPPKYEIPTHIPINKSFYILPSQRTSVRIADVYK